MLALDGARYFWQYWYWKLYGETFCCISFWFRCRESFQIFHRFIAGLCLNWKRAACGPACPKYTASQNGNADGTIVRKPASAQIDLTNFHWLSSVVFKSGSIFTTPLSVTFFRRYLIFWTCILSAVPHLLPFLYLELPNTIACLLVCDLFGLISSKRYSYFPNTIINVSYLLNIYWSLPLSVLD